MASHFDPRAKCRVGTMDEDQFYAECDAANAAYFRALLAAWAAAGGDTRWGAGGVGLRGAVAGGEAERPAAGICFLAPKFAGKQDRIELACTTLARQIGDARCDDLKAAIRQAAGDRVRGTTMVSVVQPGLLPAQKQTALTKAFVDLL